jgi:hypothetical protein
MMSRLDARNRQRQHCSAHQAAIAALLARRQPLLEEAGVAPGASLGAKGTGLVLMQWQVAELMRRLFLDFQLSSDFTSRAACLEGLNSTKRTVKTRGWYMTYLHQNFGGEIVVKTLLAVGAFDEDLAASMREVREEIRAEGPRPIVSPRTRAQVASARAAVRQARRAAQPHSRQRKACAAPRSNRGSSAHLLQQPPAISGHHKAWTPVGAPPSGQEPAGPRQEPLPVDRCVHCSYASTDIARCVRCTAPLCTWHCHNLRGYCTCKDGAQCLARRRLWATNLGVLPVPGKTKLAAAAAPCPAGCVRWDLQFKLHHLAQLVQAPRPQPGQTFADRVVQRWIEKKHKAGSNIVVEPVRWH